MPITITVNGATTTGLREIPAEASRLAILRLSQIAYDSAQKGAGAHNKPQGTGALFDSLFLRQIPGGRIVGHDLARAPHAVFVHWGTRPHKIRPKTKKLLRWATNGQWRSAREVNHPGYKGDPWMIRAADDAIRQFAAVIDTAFKDAAK